MAKAEGYVARSAYKLIQINESRRLVRPGDRVLDLGCAPGSWLQVLAKMLGPGGMALGIDLKPVEVTLPANIHTEVGDAFKVNPAEILEVAAHGGTPRKFDVIVSDMAPNTSGHGDDFMSARLCERVMDVCPALLRPGGNLLMKILEGEPTPGVIARAKRMFAQAGTTKPEASRDVSREIFIWGTFYVEKHGSA